MSFRAFLLAFSLCYAGGAGALESTKASSADLFLSQLALPHLGPKTPGENLIDYRQRMRGALSALDQKNRELTDRLSDEKARLSSRVSSAETSEERTRARQLLGQNFQQRRQLRRAVMQRRRAIQQAYNRETQKSHETQYYNCMNDTKKFSIDTTEADFCLDCQTPSEPIALSQEQIQQTQEGLQWEDFKDKLKARAGGAVLARVSHIRFLRACALNDTQKIKDWLKNLPQNPQASRENPNAPENNSALAEGASLNAEDIQKLCRPHIAPLEDSLTELWGDMRINLALSKADQAMTSASRWGAGAVGAQFMDISPSHKFWDFGALPSLSREETQEAIERYADDLSKNVELEKLTPEEFKQKMISGEIRPQMFVVNSSRSAALFENTNLSLQDRDNLRKAVRELAEKNRQEYFNIMAEQPLLAWVNSQTPGSQELDSALGEMESRLIDLLEKLEDKENLPDQLLLSFEPFVESLLAETAPDSHTNSPYCNAVEKARAKIQAETESSESQLFALEMTAIIPCLAPAMLGGLGLLICVVGAGGFLSFEALQSAQSTDDSLDQVIMRGKMFDHLSDAFFEGAEDEADKTDFRQDIFTQLAENESQFNQNLMLLPVLGALEFVGGGKAIKALKETYIQPAIKKAQRNRQKAQPAPQ